MMQGRAIPCPCYVIGLQDAPHCCPERACVSVILRSNGLFPAVPQLGQEQQLEASYNPISVRLGAPNQIFVFAQPSAIAVLAGTAI
jgi:hypothetical protein